MKTIPPLLSCLVLLSALAAEPSTLNAAVVVIDDFEAGEGHFASAPNASGSRRRILDSSTADQTFTEFVAGTAGQQLILNRNPDPSAPAPAFPSGPGEWYLRHLSGGGTIANNTTIPNTGSAWVGFWVKTEFANVEVGLIVDDDFTGTANNHEMSIFLPVLGDGLWHLYQFELADANSWEPFAGSAGPGGEINSATVTLDSLSFRGVTGVEDSVTIFIDNITYSTDGPIPVPEPAAAGLMALGALALRRRRRERACC